ncbi:hypothetical protein RS130_07705 [Paraglaciecola aquimarina]|uniref:Uncharacterized protein n=1 Tax=Paraglaciecola aquimarina TaxID=1235557 RepID=A0ABU3SUZ4_9ALTE|nr:hypothetical protein [Paraglaciecola aquimarina]MDU0353826.1 hypothetical protein [Paraglaciecola aquimarina]
MQPVTLLKAPISWAEEISVDLNDSSFSSGTIVVNQSKTVDIFKSPF